MCNFKGVSNFLSCRYGSDTKINFGGVTGFSRMLIEWESNENASGEFPDSMEYLGLVGHLEYNDAVYAALIRNYLALGWFDDADGAYYTNRRERRIRRHFLWRVAELVFFELSFGYGVKPWRLLLNFVLFCIIFSLYYLGFLRRPGDWFSRGLKPWNPFSDRWRCFFWALIHSLNILTPGIDLQDTSFMESSRYKLVMRTSRKLVWVQRAQQILGWYLLALFLVMFGKIWVR